jgi:hypothetical protein
MGWALRVLAIVLMINEWSFFRESGEYLLLFWREIDDRRLSPRVAILI